MTKKILVLLGMYQPCPSANGICVNKVIRELQQQGYTVHCIANGILGRPKSDEYENVPVYRIKPRWFYRVTEWCAINRKKPFSQWIVAFAQVVNKAKLFLLMPFWPRISPMYTRQFYKQAEKLYKVNHYDIVIGVYTPLDSLIASYKLKINHPEVTFIPYFLDSLSGGYGPRCFSRESIIRRGLKLEEKIFSHADKIVIMRSSVKHHEQYNVKNWGKFCVLDIPLLDRIDCEPFAGTTQQKKMVYAGSINCSIRDPQFLIRVLKLMCTEDIELIFAGPIDCLPLFKGLHESFGDRLVLTGRIPHEEIQCLLSEADVLLNIGNANEYMVPSKIFEYMSTGKPIISTVPIENEPSAVYLKQYPLALILDEARQDYEQIANEVTTFLHQTLGKVADYEKIERQFSTNTPKAFVEMLRKFI